MFLILLNLCLSNLSYSSHCLCHSINSEPFLRIICQTFLRLCHAVPFLALPILSIARPLGSVLFHSVAYPCQSIPLPCASVHRLTKQFRCFAHLCVTKLFLCHSLLSLSARCFTLPSLFSAAQCRSQPCLCFSVQFNTLPLPLSATRSWAVPLLFPLARFRAT